MNFNTVRAQGRATVLYVMLTNVTVNVNTYQINKFGNCLYGLNGNLNVNVTQITGTPVK